MRARPSHLLVAAALLLGGGVLAAAPAVSTAAGPAAAADKGGKWQDDPRSNGALNRLAAQNPAKPPPAMYDAPPELVGQSPVNNPGADATAQDTQSETTIAVLGNKVTVAWNDSGSFSSNNHFTGFGHSTNTGLSFTDRGALPNSTEGDAGDPVLAADPSSGSVYLSTLGFTTGENIQVFKSTDGGSTFGAPVNGTPGYAGSGSFQDKEWMAVDTFAGTGQGNVYLCWTKFPSAGSAEIRFTRSTDGGATFGPSLGTLLSTGGQGCYVVVGPGHRVYVFYYRGTGTGGQGGDNKLFVRRSTDLGVSFGPEVQVADLLTTTTNGNLGLSGGFRSNSFPHAAVNRANGDLYVVYNDNPADADNADSFLTRSEDFGMTWSAPVQINNDDAGRDQFFPTVGVRAAGDTVMVGYYSRVTDGTSFHRRGRLAAVDPTTGALSFRPSFQLGPDTPVAIGQDPVINSVYMGDYDQIVASGPNFHSSWADNRLGNAFHAHQPDVQYARINGLLPSTNPGISVTAPANAAVGDNMQIRATVTNPGANAAEDTFAVITLPAGLVPKAVVANGGGRCFMLGQVAECALGTVAPGGSKTVDITAFVTNAGTKTTTARVMTSGSDTAGANNSASDSTTTSGSGVSQVYSTGAIAVPILDNTTVDIPIDVEDDGAVLSVSSRVRLNHTFDGDVSLFLISPAGTIVDLSSRNGGSGDNYGTGANDCTGTKTAFLDGATTSITAGAAPFAGNFRPEQAQSAFASENPQGTWKLRVQDSVSADTGTVGCVQIIINRSP